MNRETWRWSLLVCVAGLVACDDVNARAPSFPEAKVLAPSQNAPRSTEAALIDQISCRRPPQAGVAMSAMLRNHLIAITDDGGDGIILFVPVEGMTLFGFEVVRLGGWQADPNGGAMPPFSRGPGTAPPNHLSVTVKATEADVKRALSDAGLVEARYVPDYSQDPWVDVSGTVIQPQRLVPGPSVSPGDDELASNPVAGATTIVCSANDFDFEREVAAQFGG